MVDTAKVGILWDIDGTLSDSFSLCYESTVKVLTDNGLDRITHEQYHQGTKLTTPRRLAWHVTGDPDNEVGENLGQQFDDLYVKLVNLDTAALYPGMQDLLRTVSDPYKENLKYAALSNACGAYAKAVIEVNGLSDTFHLSYGADDVPAAKPSPAGLLEMCRLLELDPKRCVYVGDSPSDGQAAEAAGMKGVGVTWGSHPVETVEPAFSRTVHSVAELQVTLLEWLQTILSKEIAD